MYDNESTLPKYYYPPRPSTAPALNIDIPPVDSWREGHGRPSTACPGDKRSVIKNKSAPIVFSCVNCPRNRSNSCDCKFSYRKSEKRSKSSSLKYNFMIFYKYSRREPPVLYKPKIRTSYNNNYHYLNSCSLTNFKTHEEVYKYHNATPPVRSCKSDTY